MAYTLSPIVRQQFNNNGAPVTNGLLFAFAAGTTNKINTYKDATGLTPNTNPIVLDANGSCDLWLSDAQPYKLILSPAGDTDPPTNPLWTRDNIWTTTNTLQVQSAIYSYTAAPDSGTVNALAVTLSPAPTALSAGMQVTVQSIVATNTGSATLNVNGLGALPIQGAGGNALAGGELAAGFDAILMLNPAGTAWILIQTTGGALPIVAGTKPNHAVNLSQVPGLRGAFKNLTVSAVGGSSNVSVLADELILESAASAYSVARTVSLTINSAASGLNGLDTGSLAASTWYSVWVIGNGTTVAGLLSMSATAPTLPAGYTYSARIGWIRTDGSANKYPLGFTQHGRTVQYLVSAGSNLVAMPQMAVGAAGSTTAPTYVSVAVGNYVPPTAGKIKICASANASGGTCIVAPNGSYGAAGTSVNPPPIVAVNNGTVQAQTFADMVLESGNIYWAAQNANCVLVCSGWEDNL